MTNKPAWRDAPHFANWLAQDRSGIWCWYEIEPRQLNGIWGSLSEWAKAGHGDQNEDWNKTLERRPCWLKWVS